VWDLLLAVVVLANASWTQGSAIQARVHAHEFDRVSIQSQDCSLTAKVWFSAPESGYTDRSKVRNVYRFRARVKLDGGREMTSGEFRTSTPGRKVWTWTHDTSADGCWAKQKPPLRQVLVEGCRGKGCPVPAFE